MFSQHFEWKCQLCGLNNKVSKDVDPKCKACFIYSPTPQTNGLIANNAKKEVLTTGYVNKQYHNHNDIPYDIIQLIARFLNFTFAIFHIIKRIDPLPFEVFPGIKTYPKFSRLESLTPLSIGANLLVHIYEIYPVHIRKNLDDTVYKTMDVLMVDETACCLLKLRNDQCDWIKKKDILILRNIGIEMKNEHYITVYVDRWGIIEKVDPNHWSPECNLDIRISEIYIDIKYHR